MENNLQTRVCKRFITASLPEISTDESAYCRIIEFIERYGGNNTIRALAATIEHSTKKTFSSINNFLSYTNGILRKTEEEERDEVMISLEIEKKYKVREWLALL